MAKIIVAIDFSKGSMHALDYAIRFANNYKSDIIMVWVDNSVSPDAIYTVSSYDDRSEVKEHFNEIVSQKQKELTGGKLSFKMKKGKVYHEVSYLASKENADFVIAGTHGVSGYEKFWIGSNAYRIVIYSPCPVITIKYGFEFGSSISNIVLPIDNSSDTIQKVPYTAKLAKSFNSKVHLLGLYSTHLNAIHKKVDSYVQRAADLLSEEDVKFVSKTIQVEDIAHATIDYSKQNNVDLISIMTEQEKAKADILLGAYAQQMVYYSPFPVLCVRTNK
jgi:nucleotide-binding universal stress UspA family protein